MVLFERWLGKIYKYGLEYFRLYYGIYRGTCMDNEDPEEQGRILARVPAITGKDTSGSWLWPSFPWAGKDSGCFLTPDVGDPVLVWCENGKGSEMNYIGGWFPKPKGDNYTPKGAYTNGKPTARIIRTKAGHEISFDDNQENLTCKFVWHDPVKDIYSFVAFTKEGNIQMANHKGSFLEMRAKDDDELNMMVDMHGNTIVQDKNGTKIIDADGNVMELKKDTIQFIGKKNFIINVPSINFKTGGVDIGDIATDKAIKGTSFMTWWKTVFLLWLNTHTHPTGVGPSGPPIVPHQAPVDTLVLTDKLKMQ